MDSSDAVVFYKYENLLSCLPPLLQPPALADTLLKICCPNFCCHKFSPLIVMKARLLLPSNYDNGQSPYNAILSAHFFLMKLCFIDNAVAPKICNTAVRAEFFRRVYSIPERRYYRLQNQLVLQFESPIWHGNCGRLRESVAVLERIGRLVNAVTTFSEIRPDGKGYQFPSSMTKKELLEFAVPSQPKKLNPTVELSRLVGSFHFHKNNDFTKCNTCVTYKAGLKSKRFKSEFVAEAKMHLKNHYSNTQLDRRDYYTRMHSSRSSEELLSISHDGFSKMATKFPHLFEEHLKKLTDPTKMFCSLNLAVVHKKFKIQGSEICVNAVDPDTANINTGQQNDIVTPDQQSGNANEEGEITVNSAVEIENEPVARQKKNAVVNEDDNTDGKDQLHAYWNVGQIQGSDSNVLISQIYHAISQCSTIPNEISIQLDNCASNKSYDVLGSFGLLMLWVPEITRVYLCYPEVGHTHDDVDRYFSCLARPLNRNLFIHLSIRPGILYFLLVVFFRISTFFGKNT